MLDIDELQAVQKIVTHANCPDGIASALILHHVIPNAEVVFVTHGTPEYENLQAEQRMLFCDITPPENNVGEFIAREAIVLDHHKSAKKLVQAFGRRGVFADELIDPGISGAMLAYIHVWKRIALLDADRRPAHFEVGGMWQPTVEGFARLASIRDTWQKHDVQWEDACAQAEWLRFYQTDEMLSDPRFFNELRKRELVGEVLRKKRLEADKEMLKRGYKLELVHGLKALIIPTLETSDIAEMVRSEFDVVVGFAYYATSVSDGQQIRLRLSLRAGPKFDCALFCQPRGGGGHTPAAGCTMDVDYYSDKQPYGEIHNMLISHIATHGVKPV